MSKQSDPPPEWSEFGKGASRWMRPFLYVEWLTEHAVARLDRWAFVELVRIVAGLSVVWAGLTYACSADDRRIDAERRRKANHYQAWQVINSARGSPGNGGRVDAIHDLYADTQSLQGIDLRHAYLDGLNVPLANFRAAILDSGIVDFRNGRGLDAANLHGNHARISGELNGANFFEASLEGAVLWGSLCGVDFRRADLQRARIYARLDWTTFRAADLRNAAIGLVNDYLPAIQTVDFRGANVFGLHVQRDPAGLVARPVNFAQLDSLLISRALASGAVLISDDSVWESQRTPRITLMNESPRDYSYRSDSTVICRH